MKLRLANLLGLTMIFIFGVFLAIPVLAAAPLSISYEYSQGLAPAGTSLFLQAGTATYQEWSDDKRVRVNFSVSQKEMDSLYSNLRWYSFSGIETSKIKAYDRGGDSVTLVANNKTTTKSNAGQSTIKGAFSKWRYEKIVNNLKAFSKKKLAAQYVNYKIDLETSGIYGVRVAVDDAEVQLHAGKASVALLPGKHTILVGLYGNKDEIVNAEAAEITVPDSDLAHIRVGDKNIFILPE